MNGPSTRLSRRRAIVGGAAVLLTSVGAARAAAAGRTVRLQLFMTQSALPKSRRGLAKMHARVYALTSPDGFAERSFRDLYRDWYEPMETPVLARAQVDFHFRRLATVDLDAPDGTRFIGVIAPYRTLSGKTWLAVASYDPKRRDPVEIDIDRQRVWFR